ncbi:MAG: hypothetical protein HDKAJFGB_03803 [Anaerolineae bacterium]|nr:hypothetical protein [Anaerolineae bacterium]
MLILLMWVNVLAEQVEPFMVTTLEMAHASLRERGCRRFEALRNEQFPTQFILSALFNSRADAELHLQMEHYQNWQEATAGMLAEAPRLETFTQLF